MEAVIERLLRDIFEFKEAAQIGPEQKQLNGIFEEAVQIDPDPEQLNEIFEVEEAAQINPEPEQLNSIFEFVEASQIGPEQEQLNNGFPESNKKHKLILDILVTITAGQRTKYFP